MERVIIGLEQVTSQIPEPLKNKKVAYLCHSASIDHQYNLGVLALQKLLGKNLIKLFGPQHGFATDVQDNMIETKDVLHPYFKIPVHSLYSHTRIPTDEMLKGVEVFVVDLQDVGTRVYTYISTLALTMQACGKKDIKVVILDRPNPVGGTIIEGPVLQKEWHSFVGHHRIPQRHSLTMGEIALFTKKFCAVDCEVEVIKMKHWKRSMFFKDTGLPWANPSPNLPTMESAITYVGTVLYEGTNISEGRGTTRPLEICGHPAIEPFSFADHLTSVCHQAGLRGFLFRPIIFVPTFHKFGNEACGGVHLHILPGQEEHIRPWALCQILCRELKATLGPKFKWRDTPYEYEYDRLAIDLINGTDQVRQWVDKKGSVEELKAIEEKDWPTFLQQKEAILLYP